MKVAFFGTAGVITAAPLAAVAERHEVALFVRPGPPPSLARRVLARLRPSSDPCEHVVRSRRIPVAWMRGPHDPSVAEALRRIAPDLICVSTFRWLLPETLLATARLGAINLHSSLLPRHRGAVPLFSIFLNDDRETGVTIHRVTPRADAGPIVATDSWPLARGTTAAELNDENARRGAALLVRAIDLLAAGRVTEQPQDESRALAAPKPPRSGRHVDWSVWPSERVWHFLHAVHPYYQEEITAHDGAALTYAGVVGYVEGDGPRGGEVHIAGDEIHVGCADGFVRMRKVAR